MDNTEPIRRQQIAEINAVNPPDPTESREYWEGLYGQVWDTSELSKDFEVLSFMAPYVMVRQKSTDKKGLLEFSHRPRFYFNFVEQ